MDSIQEVVEKLNKQLIEIDTNIKEADKNIQEVDAKINNKLSDLLERSVLDGNERFIR